MNLPYSFLDLETTGGSSRFDRVIDIGIIKTDGEKIIDKFETLINPGQAIDPFITKLTGITNEQLVYAPTFREVLSDIEEILKDTILVAHNVRFDYGFLKGEFKRFEKTFNSKHMCTVKLSRRLYPDHRLHNLDSIIERFGLKCERRHRAFDDAKAIFEFFQLAQQQIDPAEFESALNFCMKRPSLPINIPIEIIDNLPEKPGVYIFYGDNREFPLYIGKSVNIRDRVLSHFSNDLVSGVDREIAEQIKSIEYIETAGELSALLLESSLIKEQQPLYNRMLRYARKMTVLLKKETDDGYLSVEAKEIERIDVEDTKRLLGTFRSQKQLKDILYEISKAYNLCPKVLGLEKGKGRCFYYGLKYCKGACVQKELNLKYNLRFEEAFYKYKIKKWFFDGPILIREKGDRDEGFVVDKWCLLGRVKQDSDLENLSNDYRFDLDTYKILARFLLNPGKNISINPIQLQN